MVAFSKELIVTIFTDGSSIKDRAGMGIYVKPGHRLNRSIPLKGKCAGFAEYAIIKIAMDDVLADPEYCKARIIICTDRKDLIDKMNGTAKQTFKKGSKIKEIYTELQASYRKFKKGQITLQKVDAHTNEKDGNYYADKLAGYASGKENDLPKGILTNYAEELCNYEIKNLNQ
uniref:RNase H type-1 domain-containing protein n=1 Tax=Panagrolaimus davidi TaxID=227884 RepID=A0A914QQH6_9BILA